jgi:uncharacterized protein
MGFDQYHEPAAELSAETRTFARMIASLTEEAEAIGWYEQRMALEPDPQAKAIMANAQGEEFKHFGMDLEFLIRRTPNWRIALQTILFTEGDIVESGEEAEEAENREFGPQRTMSSARRGEQPRSTRSASACQSTRSAKVSARMRGRPRRLSCSVRHS